VSSQLVGFDIPVAPRSTIESSVVFFAVFSVFSVLYLKQPVRWNHVAGFAMIVAAVGVIFKKW